MEMFVALRNGDEHELSILYGLHGEFDCAQEIEWTE